MKGIDISHWQGDINWQKVKTDFAIIKCSEGIKYIDPKFAKNKKEARENNILIGYYHFANGGDPKKEADFFIKSVGDINTGELLVLDWEIDNPDPAKWCKKFLDRVQEKTGIKALLYASEYRIKSAMWKIIVDGNYGLWVAKYGSDKVYVPYYLQRSPSSGVWPFYAIWQYSSKGSVDGISGNVDMNYTKMSLETLKKYGKREELKCNHCPIHCPK